LIYRVIDLEGKLVGKRVAIDPKILNRVYRTMIYTDEMDTILLKAKGQGISNVIFRQNLILYDIVW
jgi:hypothetical protein